MTTVQKPNLSEQKIHNWIKQGIALVITKEGLQDIVKNEMSEFQQKIYGDIQKKRTSPLNSCNSCTTESIVKCTPKNKLCSYNKRKCILIHKPCPLNICENVRDEITVAHRFSGPSWKNTDAQKWSSSDWEIAKCFMPLEGYKHVFSAAETDFNGILSVLINFIGFETKVQEDLSNVSNIFCKAREIGKSYRHSTSFEVSNREFMENLHVLKSLLGDPKHIALDENAQIALNTLQELSSQSWTITDKDIARHLQEAIDEAKESIDKTKDKLLEEARQVIESNTEQDISSVLTRLQQFFSKHKEEIEEAVEQGVKRIRTESDSETIYKRRKIEAEVDYDKLKEEFRQRLVRTYMNRCSNLPISPLLQEEELPLLTFYVQPCMRRVEHHRVQREEISVESYEDVFRKGGYQCKNIYVTGDAGIGKTVMCQRMVYLWCLIHHYESLELPDETISKDSKSMEYFDFVFYLSLRDAKYCRIEDVIQHQIMGLLESKELLRKILHTEKCLIILDGLDEWSHQYETTDCPGNTKVPHREGLENCVFLTTSRPYKLERLRLGTHEVDQQIEILPMEEGVDIAYVELVVDLLNDKCGKKNDPAIFLEEVVENKLEDLLDVPLLTTHLICLWFDEKLRHMSVSEVYANTLEMMFSRASQRRSRSEPSHINVTESDGSTLQAPRSLRNLKHVMKHIHLLLKLSDLAFATLFVDKESSLVFSDSDLEGYRISEEMITYLCSVGILSKSKAIGFLTERRHTISFPHKLYQEFMAALYISMSPHKEDYIRSTILKACKSLADVKKFSDVFIFLASLAPYAVESLFQKVNAALSEDQAVSGFREFSCSAMFSFISQRRKQVEDMVKSLQDLAVKCFNECKRSGGRNIDFKLEDIFIYKNNVSQIQEMLRSGTTCVKSVFTTGNYLEDELHSMTGLVRLEIRYIKSIEDFQKYSDLMSTSCKTLKNLSLNYCDQISELPLETLNHLTSVYVHNVKVKHNQLTKLVDFISNKQDMSQIGLDAVECEDHKHECTLGKFDLRCHKKLYLLGIGSVNFESVDVDSSVLYRLNLDYKKTIQAACWAKPLLEHLLGARVLKKVVIRNVSDRSTVTALVRMLSSLQSLKYIYLLNIDFNENILWLDPEAADVDIEMSHVTLTFDSFRYFLRKIAEGQNSVSLNLLFYNINPPKSDVLGAVRSHSRLTVLRETDCSLKLKNQRQVQKIPSAERLHVRD